MNGETPANALRVRFTPGPWRVRMHPNGGHCFVTANDVNGFAFGAEILGDDEYRDREGQPGSGFERRLADCKLIAQAPAMAELVARVAWLNRNAGEIGAGMLAQLVDEARRIMGEADLGDASQNKS